MATTASKLNRVRDSKENIKEALVGIGVTVNTTFENYNTLITPLNTIGTWATIYTNGIVSLPFPLTTPITLFNLVSNFPSGFSGKIATKQLKLTITDANGTRSVLTTNVGGTSILFNTIVDNETPVYESVQVTFAFSGDNYQITATTSYQDHLVSPSITINKIEVFVY